MCERGEGENREGKDADSRMCRTHERNYAEQRELKSLSYFGIG